MYLDFFGFNRNPFPSTPQLDFFYSGGDRDATIDAIDYALSQNFGVIKIIGKIGCGKTILCRQAYRQLAEDYDILFLSDPSLDSAYSILTAVASEINPELDLCMPKNKLYQKIIQILVEQRASKPTVLFIEEAQKLTPAQLEDLRYLTNLETSQDKLLQLVLFGQPSLDAVLLKTNTQLLSSRISHNLFLRPLSFHEFVNYTKHRFEIAGSRAGQSLIPKSLLWMIHKISRGSLRRANQLMEKTLFSAYLRKNQTPSIKDLVSAFRSIEPVGAEHKYTRGQLASVFSLGLLMGWLTFTLTKPITLKEGSRDTVATLDNVSFLHTEDSRQVE